MSEVSPTRSAEGFLRGEKDGFQNELQFHNRLQFFRIRSVGDRRQAFDFSDGLDSRKNFCGVVFDRLGSAADFDLSEMLGLDGDQLLQAN